MKGNKSREWRGRVTDDEGQRALEKVLMYGPKLSNERKLGGERVREVLGRGKAKRNRHGAVETAPVSALLRSHRAAAAPRQTLQQGVSPSLTQLAAS